jgi:chromosome segregation ATPase
MKIDQATQMQVLDKVANMNAEGMHKDFSDMQLSIQKTFAGLQVDVTNRYATLEELNTAISLKQSRLKDLHSIEAAAISLDDLQAQLEQQRGAIVQERNDADQAQADTQTAWAQQKKRIEDEWIYGTDQKHRKTLDDFNQQLLKQQRDEATRQEALQKNWKDREEVLAEREAELTSLREKVDNFPDQMSSEVKKQVAINENVIKKHYETELQLLRKDNEANTKLNAEREQALKSTVSRLEGQAVSLQNQVESAEKRAAEIAKTAFESVSGRDALAAVQRHSSESQQQQAGKGGR